MNTEDVVDRLELAYIRALLQMDVTEPTDRLAAAVGLQRRLDNWATRELLVARDDGTTYAQLARAMGVSRQAVRQRVARLTAPSTRSQTHLSARA